MIYVYTITMTEENNPTGTIPAFIVHLMLISKYVPSTAMFSNICSTYTCYIRSIINHQPKLLLKHGEVLKIGVSIRIQVLTHSL